MMESAPVIGLSIATLACGTGAILSAYHPKGRPVFVILKPFTTVLIIAIVAASMGGSGLRYQGLIAVGLLFSLAGDILLMLPPRYFAPGILCFAITHVSYFFAFVSVSGIALVHLGFPLFCAIAVGLAILIWPGVDRSLRLPVSLYTLLITLMAAQAVGSAAAAVSIAPLIAAAGALCFFASDATLAIDRFRMPFSAAHAVVLSMYWLGQWLIAISAAIRSLPG